MLLSKGAKVYITARTPKEAEKAINDLKGAAGKESVFLLTLNLADLQSVKAAAEDFISKEQALHTLYNNG